MCKQHGLEKCIPSCSKKFDETAVHYCTSGPVPTYARITARALDADMLYSEVRR